MRFFLTLLLPVIFHVVLNAQNAPVERLTIEDGLSQGMIFDMLQTRDGFMWFATKDGLNRYDGYQFKVFSKNPFDPYSLSGNVVTTLFEDSKGRLWVGTESNGLNLYDPEKQRFLHLEHQEGQQKGLSDNSILAITEDPSGAIWIVTLKQMANRLRLPDKLPSGPSLNETVEWAGPPIHLPDLVSVNSSFVCADDGRLLIEYSNVPTEINWRTGEVRPMSPVPGGAAQKVWAIYQDKNGGLWFGQDQCARILKNGKIVSLKLGVPGDVIIDITEDAAGNVWMCSETALWRVKMESGKYEEAKIQEIYRKTPGQIRGVKTDRTGGVWLATNGYGLLKYNPGISSFSNVLPGQSIWSIYADLKGDTWINLFNQYYRFASNGDMILHAKVQEQGLFGMVQDRRFDYWFLRAYFREDPAHTVWLEHYSPTLQFIDKMPFHTGLSQQNVMLEDSAGNLWMGFRRGELVRYNPVLKQFRSLSYAYLIPSYQFELECIAMMREQDGTFWIGTNHGLIRGMPVPGADGTDSLRFNIYQTDLADRESLVNNFVLCVYPDPSGRFIWVGTKGGGIGRFEKSSGKFRFFDQKDGLPNNVVYGILPDAEHNLWCSTNRGLSRMSLKADGQAVFKNYGIQDGLPGLEFNTSAFSRQADGELMFGGVQGLTTFDPNHLTVNRIAPKTVITGIQVNTKELLIGENNTLRMAPELCDAIALNWDDNQVSIRFAALDFTAPEQNRYRYRLSGIDDDWVESGENNFANYSHLGPGVYRFEVTGSNSDGVWSDKPATLTITIRPPWWKTWWAYSLLAILLVASAFYLYRSKIKRITLENAVLNEKREAERLAEMDGIKTRFFNNVTHEFRTPLTLIVEPLRQLLQNPGDPALIEKIRLAEINSKRLSGLVNQLLDMAKIESGHMKLDMRRGDIRQLLRLLVDSFLPLAEQRGVKLKMMAKADIPPFAFDPVKVEVIVNNLLSNALKFTPPGGRVQINITADQSSRSLTILVEDTGIGIEKEEQNKVFDRFYQVETTPDSKTVEGTGIGLALSRELALLMGGDIALESAPGKGSRFSFHLPMPDGESALPIDIPSEPAPVKKEATPKAVSGEKPVVLVIEDNQELRRFIKKSIGKDWQVAEASNGAEGIRKAGELMPDLVISDVMMPDKDGYDVCEALKSNVLTAHIPVILLTAKSGVEAKISGLRHGADDYLTKPFNTDELLARMNNLVAMRRKLLRGRAESHGNVPQEGRLSAPDQAFLRKLNMVLEEYLADESFSVEDLAQKMLLSRMQLHRKLKALNDQSAGEYMRTFRLDRAMALLKNREGNVGQVAAMVGFGNEKYFSTAFRERFGKSPSEV